MKRYKNNDKIIFKGVTYRYKTSLGEFHRVDKESTLAEAMPETLMCWDDKWTIHSLSAPTPEALLKKYLQAVIAMHVRSLKALQAAVTDKKDFIKKLKSKNLKEGK